MRNRFLQIVTVCFSVYFAYHLISGNRGALSYLSLTKTIKSNELILNNLEKEIKDLESMVKLLKPGSVCSDLLEERSRIVNGFGYKDELVISINE